MKIFHFWSAQIALFEALLRVCFVTEDKISISRNIFRPDSLILVISFVAPHYWHGLSTRKCSAMPSRLSVKIPAIVIYHKVSISLNN